MRRATTTREGAGYFRFVTGTEAILHRSADARGMGIEAAGSRGVIRVSDNVVRMWRRPDEDPGAPVAERDSWQRLQPVDGVFPEGSIRNWDKGSHDGWGIPANRQAATVQELVTALDAGDAPLSDGINGRAVLEMAIAIRESHRKGYAPVRLPLADRSLRLLPTSRPVCITRNRSGAGSGTSASCANTSAPKIPD